jgi:integrase
MNQFAAAARAEHHARIRERLGALRILGVAVRARDNASVTGDRGALSHLARPPRPQALDDPTSCALGAAPAKKVALLRDALLGTISRIDVSTTAGLRDRALLLVGFALGLRRSDLVAITVEDTSPHPDGVLVRLVRSTTDQAGTGKALRLAYAEDRRPCPVRALGAWLDAAAITEGAVFRRVTRTGAIWSPLSAQSVALIIKRRVTAAGLEATPFAGHSLRSGFARRPHATVIAPTRSRT